MGVTVVYASGDYGVAGNGGGCLDNGVRVSLRSDFHISSVMHRSPLVSNSSTRGFDAKLRCANSGLIVLLSVQVVPVCLPIHHQYRRYPGKMNEKPTALDLTFFVHRFNLAKLSMTRRKPRTTVIFPSFFWLRFNPDSINRVVLQVIYSGGGFSNNFGLPSYQANDVRNWWKEFGGSYSSNQTNTSRKARGFPVRVSIIPLHSCDICGTCCILTNPLSVSTGHFC